MKKIICKIILLITFFFCYEAVNDRYYPRYHLAPPGGWMNDPNGFCYFNNEFHLFYQHNPHSSMVPGVAHWGHAKSKDLFHWEHLKIALYPDQWYDKHGVFSGSAIVENNTMYLFYSGNINHQFKNYDHEEYQALATSTDGVNIVKYSKNPLISAVDRQPNVRDPKIWKHQGKYYMVVGNSFENDTFGRVLIYVSSDKINWEDVAILGESDGFLGFMWECPDLFPLGDDFVFLFSPQGLKPEGDSYKNLYQVGYIVGKFDYNTYNFTSLTEFRELDHGHDFYATQTMEDPYGRRLLVSWLDMWDRDYPEREDGFAGQMSIIRELSMGVNGQVLQNPVRELNSIRGPVLYRGPLAGKKNVTIPDNTGEVRVRASPFRDLLLQIESNNNSRTVFIYYDSKNYLISLDRGGKDAVRRTTWKPVGELNLRLYIDASSIEMFCGAGEVTFSSRFFPVGDIRISFGNGTYAEHLEVYSIQRTIPKLDK